MLRNPIPNEILFVVDVHLHTMCASPCLWTRTPAKHFFRLPRHSFSNKHLQSEDTVRRAYGVSLRYIRCGA